MTAKLMTPLTVIIFSVSGMLMMYAIPAAQLASGTIEDGNLVGPIDDDVQEQNLAQELVDDTRQRIEQDAEQEQEQEQEIEQDVEAEAESESGDAEAEEEVKTSEAHHSSSSSTSADADSSATATATATGTQDNDNTAAIAQDSSADNNIQVNENVFGNDTATQVGIPIADQDQTAENRGVNLDIEIVRIQPPPPPTTPTTPPPPPPEQEFCVDFIGAMGAAQACFPTLAECEEFQANIQEGGAFIQIECRPVPADNG
jgi:hypothetical protein